MKEALAPNTNERIVITNPEDTVALRQLVPDDALAYFELIEADTSHLSQFGDVTAKKYPTEESVKQSIAEPSNPSKYRFGIWDNDVMVGSNNLTPEDSGSAELGWWIGKEHTGSGYAARACKLVLSFAFDQLQLDRVFAKIKIGNVASRKTAEKAGLKLIKTEGDEWIYGLEKREIKHD